MSDLERAAAFEEAIRDACAERVVETRFGPVIFNDTFSIVWNLNVLRADEPQGASGAEIAAEADRIQGGAGLRHRRVILPPGDDRLVEDFRALGWVPDNFLFMVHRRPPERTLDTRHVEEIDPGVLTSLRQAIVREWSPSSDEETVRQIVAADYLMWEAANARYFAVFEDGRAVSAAALYSDGRTAQVEDVATMPAYRRRGHASAIVERAVEEAWSAGHEFVFLVADGDGWPKGLYRRLGFDEVGSRFAFVLPNAASPVPSRGTAGP